jgi:uncharacterized glyoxalase superfamily protein PhnB
MTSTTHAHARRRDGADRIRAPEDLHGSHTVQAWVYIALDDVDVHYQRAKAAGVEVLNEPHDAMDSAQRGYSARDLEGNLWSFGTASPKR